MISFSHLIKYFKRVETPRYLDMKIQEIALDLFNLKDMGKLRDTYDAQRYLDNISDEIRAEYAFEKFIGIEFDFEKRKVKNYKRLEYQFSDKALQLIPITSKKIYPIKKIEDSIIIYLKPEKVAYIGGLIKKSQLKKYISSSSSIFGELNLDLNKLDLNKVKYFENIEELIKVLNSKL
mgnify:CR=1 FL=1